MIEGFFGVLNFRFWDFFGTKIWQVFLVAWFFVGTFGGIKNNWYCLGGFIAVRIKYRQTNVFCLCLIVNYVVALHRTCYTKVCIVPLYPAVYKCSTISIQSVGFTVSEIPFCFSELLLLLIHLLHFAECKASTYIIHQKLRRARVVCGRRTWLLWPRSISPEFFV